MLSPAAMESLYSVTYVEDFIETIEDYPDEVQRRISLIMDLNLTLRNLQAEIESSMSYLMENMAKVDSTATEDRSKTRICKRIQEMLLTAQDIGDEKLKLTEEIKEMLENQSHLLEVDRKNIDLERSQVEEGESKHSDTENRPMKKARRRARLIPPILGPTALEAAFSSEISDLSNTSIASGLNVPATKSQAGAFGFNVPAAKSTVGSSDLNVPATKSQPGSSGLNVPAKTSQPGTSGLNVPARKSQPGSSGLNVPAKTSQPGTSGLNVPGAKSQVGASGLIVPAAKSQAGASGLNVPATKSQPGTSGLNVPATKSQAKASGRSVASTKSQKLVVVTPPESDSSPAGAVGKDLESMNTKVQKERRGRKRRSGGKQSNISDEPLYCLCEEESYGDMVKCDNDLCSIEWFHFSCVSLTTKPKGKWFCPKCRGDRPNVMKPKEE